MKRIRKIQKTIVSTLLIVFLSGFLTGCYTLDYTEYMGTEEIPRSKQLTGKQKYDFEIIQNPTVDNPEVKLKINKSAQYKAKTKKEYKDVYRNRADDNFFKNTRMTPGLWIGCVGMVGGIFGLLAIGTDSPEEGGVLLGSGAGLFLTGLITHGIHRSMKQTKTKYHYEPSDYEYYYKNPIQISNSKISITSSGKSIMFQTNNWGTLKFNPVIDFNISHSSTDRSKDFDLKYNNYDFDRSLYLYPSHFMNNYARILNSECSIKLNNHSDLNTLGIARKGMEYKILSEQNHHYEIELINKTGWINKPCAETFYSIPKKQDIAKIIKDYVEEKITKWQKQGEFESPEQYYDRMLKREQKIKETTQLAMELYQKDYANLIDWKQSTISRYNPNNQTFKIDIPDLETIVINIPINKAQKFKETWNNISFKNQKFILVDGNWEFASLELVNTLMNYSAKYDSEISNVYDVTNQFGFDLPPITVEIPSQKTTTNNFNKQRINYSINTDLPTTNMNNPDAIAVVIGNSNYLSTTSVPYAINDAQIMKLYLVNVLGYNPDNIYFIRNATKADMELYFGTKENHKGKLFNNIKIDISDVFIYFSGHGAPGFNDRKAYFVPVDCEPQYVEISGYSKDVLFNNLTKLPAKSVSVVIDACFSGANIFDQLALKSVLIAPSTDFTLPNGVIMTSSEDNQVSTSYPEQDHSTFTYFFLKAIKDKEHSDTNKDSKLTFKEIHKYLSDNTNGVPAVARKQNVEQKPTIKGDKDKVLIVF